MEIIIALVITNVSFGVLCLLLQNKLHKIEKDINGFKICIKEHIRPELDELNKHIELLDNKKIALAKCIELVQSQSDRAVEIAGKAVKLSDNTGKLVDLVNKEVSINRDEIDNFIKIILKNGSTKFNG